MYGWRIGAPPTPRFGVSEARMQTPGAKMRRGSEEVGVLEIVRPGMENSESAENRKIQGSDQPARAAAKEEGWRKRKAIVQNGAIRTELTRDASCAGLTRASIFFFAKSFYEDGWIAGSSPEMTAVLRLSRPARRSERNQQVYEITAGAISLLWDCYLQWLLQLTRVGPPRPHMSPTMCHHVLDVKLPCQPAASI